MLDTYIWLNIFLSFIVGGIGITIITIAADRFGSNIGGFIGGLPSTVVISLFFIGLVQGPEIASEATNVFPLGLGFCGLFLVCYATLAKKGFLYGLIPSLSLWLILSTLTLLSGLNNFAISLIIYIILLITSYFIFDKYLHLPAMVKKRMPYSRLQILSRGIFGGFMIAFAVFMSKIGGPVFEGLFSAFPAVFLSTIIISYRSQGLEFSRSITKPMFISGMVTLLVYPLSIRYLYLSLGIFTGTLVSYLIAMVSAYVVFRFMQRKD